MKVTYSSYFEIRIVLHIVVQLTEQLKYVLPQSQLIKAFNIKVTVSFSPARLI